MASNFMPQGSDHLIIVGRTFDEALRNTLLEAVRSKPILSQVLSKSMTVGYSWHHAIWSKNGVVKQTQNSVVGGRSEREPFVFGTM